MATFTLQSQVVSNGASVRVRPRQVHSALDQRRGKNLLPWHLWESRPHGHFLA